MDNSGNLYITISDTRYGGKGGGDKEGESGGTKTTKKERALNSIKHQALSLILNETKKAINYSVSHIGVRTGDYVSQHNAQVSVGLAYKGVGIGLQSFVGAKLGAKLGAAGGPIGAAIGAGVGILNVAGDTAHQWFDLQRQLRIQNRDIAAIRQRAGLDVYSDGSRGTEQ